jgi:hypothetical protein
MSAGRVTGPQPRQPVHKTVILARHDEIVAAFPATSTQPQAPPLPGRGFLLLRRIVLELALHRTVVMRGDNGGLSGPTRTSLTNLASRCPGARLLLERSGKPAKAMRTYLP